MKKIVASILVMTLIFSSFGSLEVNALSEKELDIKWLEEDYDSVTNFIDGISIINKGEKYSADGQLINGGKAGLIDKNGNVIVPCKYEYMESNDSTSEVFIVGKDCEYATAYDEFLEENVSYAYPNKLGLIDKTGKELLAMKYDYIGQFYNGLSVVNLGGKDEDGALIGGWGVVNEKGKFVFPCEYDDVNLLENGLISLTKGEYFAFANKNGKILSPFKYHELGLEVDGLIFVNCGGVFNDGSFLTSMWGIIDENGKEIAKCEYTNLKYLSHDVLVVRKNDTFTFINRKGEQIDQEYAAFFDVAKSNPDIEIYNINENLASLTDYSKMKLGIMDKNGKMVKTFKYPPQKLCACLDNGTISIQKNGKVGLLDGNGEELIPCIYDDIIDPYKGVAEVVRHGKHGMYDLEKKEEILPCKYIPEVYFTDKIFIVCDALNIEDFYQENSTVKWGIFDKNQNKVLDFDYDFILYIDDDDIDKQDSFIALNKGDKYGMADVNGHIIKEPIYDNFSNYSEGLSAVCINDKWAYIDMQGNQIIPFKFDMAGDFSDGVAIVKNDGKYGILTKPILSSNSAKENEAVNAIFSHQKVSMNGNKIENIEKYIINGNNYFKLRDIAKLANATESKFSVEWNAESKMILIYTNQAYHEVGTELKVKDKTDKVCVKSTNKVQINDQVVDFEAYTINGETYYKLRDLGDKLDFTVEWDAKTKTVVLEM